MFLVVFKAEVLRLDDSYQDRAKQLRLRAEQYGCLGFESYVEGRNEVALSYWPDEKSIRAWKQDELHVEAQSLGRKQYYAHYEVQVFKLHRHYESDQRNKAEAE